MNLAPDLTLLLQVAIFLAVYFALRPLLFEPMQRMLDERRRRTVEARHSAEELIEAAHVDRRRYEDSIHERRMQMAREAEAARRAAIEESNREIADARAVIGRELAAQRAAVAAQVEAARRALGAQADDIAAEMLQRVTGRTGA